MLLIHIEHKCDDTKLFKAILAQKKEFSFSVFQRLLRKKDIKVNGKKVGENVDVCFGDAIDIYLPEETSKPKIEVVFEDQNVLIANKPDGVETVAESGTNDFLHMASEASGIGLFAVHRLDRNTKGLVVFAKNKEAEKELLDAFRERTIHKFYLARVYGHMEKKEASLVAYLKKDEREMRSVVRALPSHGFVKIETKYKELERLPATANAPIRTSVLEVELLTGKMHQIRAHMAFIGHPIVGDGKYADNEANQKMKKRKQMLVAYKLVFDMKNADFLAYLNGKTVQIDVNLAK